MVRRFLLVAGFLLIPPLLAAALYAATKFCLSATHRFLDARTMNAISLSELVLFYVAAAMELRTRWSSTLE
ncbi:MAG: hypothetical protein JOZ55_08200 [Alphaproteobacteria bacterium]|nr:hypothetical protein [Alphaproteobacteria bacterium]